MVNLKRLLCFLFIILVTISLMSCHDHSLGDWKVYREATCAEHGIERRKCFCGYYEEQEIEKLPHVEVVDKGYAATKTENGLTDGAHCSVCGEVTVPQEIEYVIPMKKNIEMLTGVRCEGYADGRLVFFFDKNADYENDIHRIEITCFDGSNMEHYIVMGTEDKWEYQITSDADKVNFNFIPISKDNKEGLSVKYQTFRFPKILETNFPRVEITTQKGVLPTADYVYAPDGAMGAGITNNEYVQSMVSVYSADNELLYTTSNKNFSGAKIRLRGNTSAQKDKAPFKVKLSEEADLLLGLVEREDTGVNYASKDWILMRCGDRFYYVIGNVANDLVGMEWTPKYSYVALYVNGDYRGLYVLTEGVQAHEARCDVSDSGYIVEVDAYWWNEDVYFNTQYIKKSKAVGYTFKHPEDVKEGSAEFNYIKDYIIEFEKALLSGEDVSDWIEIDTFAKWMLAHDIIGTWDSGGANMYLLKEDNTDGTKLKMGPAWDFDTIYGVDNEPARIRDANHFYIRLLATYNDYKKAYLDAYNAMKDRMYETIISAIEVYDTEDYNYLLDCESIRWDMDCENTDTHIARLKEWFKDREKWLAAYISGRSFIIK